MTESAEAGSESSAASTSTSEPAPEPTPTECSPSSVPVATDAAGIAPPLPGASWSVWQTDNLCGPLGYAELATTGGTGSSPTQLLLYNEGEFLGTGIRCNALGQVTGSTEDSVSVQYRWPVGNDSNANMSGRADVMFRWNGSSVDMIGSLPLEKFGAGC
ncbi:LppP/LprE family lipoprotein [Dietzia aurantiaca]|uniref:LppP/LprE family lipoprotein n=1 Tax=Dietzia aurantiaca TaxID=983873 RepID=UPI001E5D32DB|nr:LppP/LprE family lipoprotein [Dietzia aurantiaca]MCD2262445.1 LppP/LprE family lipoprotein [Dietzia aurantiaca]